MSAAQALIFSVASIFVVWSVIEIYDLWEQRGKQAMFKAHDPLCPVTPCLCNDISIERYRRELDAKADAHKAARRAHWLAIKRALDGEK